MTNSMTGFARLIRQTELAQITIELKAVNHRFLEITLSLPESFGLLDVAWRKQLREKLGRGRIEGTLRIQWHAQAQQGLPIDKTMLQQLLAATQYISEKAPQVRAPTSLDILKWPGVMNPELLDVGSLQQSIMGTLGEAIDILLSARAQEGEGIKTFIGQRLDHIFEIKKQIASKLPELIQQQEQRLLKKFEDVGIQLDSERLAQEMVLFAQRLDVAEELDRLDLHLKTVRELLHEGGRIGRKLDFMMQELNREANTLGSKSFSAEITQKIVNVKVCIEEMREQIQNIE